MYQNAEQSTPTKLEFTRLFLNDLTKQNVIKHIRDYDFDKAQDLIMDDEALQNITAYAALRLNLLYDHISESSVPDEYYIGWKNLSEFERQEIKLKDLVYSFKIQIKQKKYNDALTKLYTIFENIFKNEIDSYATINTKLFNNKKLIEGEKNLEWETFISKNLGEDYLNKLSKKAIGNKPISVTNPNQKTYFYLYRFLLRDSKLNTLITDNDVKKIESVLNSLRELRNSINHSMGSVSEFELNDEFKKHRVSQEQFYQLIDKFTGTNNFGIYKGIQTQVLNHYGETL